MDIKSRYEVVAELEEKKRHLIIEKSNLDNYLIGKKRELRDMKRNVEDKEEEIEEFEKSMKHQEQTITELIKSTEDSLNRLSTMDKQKGK